MEKYESVGKSLPTENIDVIEVMRNSKDQRTKIREEKKRKTISLETYLASNQ